MPSLWTFDEFDAHDTMRAHHLRCAPSWPEQVKAVRAALRVAIQTQNARFGVDESGRDPRDLRGVIQFPLEISLFDWFFNSTTGYRAQFRVGHANGLAMNAQLIRELGAELERLATTDVVIHRYSSDFTYKDSTTGKVRQIAATLVPKLSKVWGCEKRIDNAGRVENLFISRTGPKLVMSDVDLWCSLYPEDADGWLDVKGAFVAPNGAAVPVEVTRGESREA